MAARTMPRGPARATPRPCPSRRRSARTTRRSTPPRTRSPTWVARRITRSSSPSSAPPSCWRWPRAPPRATPRPRAAGSQHNTALFDSTYKVPRCSEEGLSCDSGTLLNGRANLGPEANRPNTLKGECPDGTSGIFHNDESIDRIKVSTPDGTDLIAGKTAKIDVTVFSYSTTTDRLDLYSAANADSPEWKLIGTLTPASAGTSTLSTTYTLPTGGVQALRARFRYNGAQAACGNGTYDDHDDLVFAVGAPATP